MTPLHGQSLLCWLAALVGLASVGCAPSDPHQLRVTAHDGPSLARWRSQVAARHARADWREFDDGLQQMRLMLMLSGEASGQDAVETALCRRIHHLTVRDVLILGHEAALQRLEREKIELQSFAAANAWLVTKPGDTSSASYLTAFRGRQQLRLETTEAAIENATRRIIALGGSHPTRSFAPAPVQNATLSRVDALAEIDRVMQKLRTVALLRFGEWPIEIDSAGRRLPAAMRGEFAARRAAAENTGHAVTAVRVRDRWFIYEGPREVPRFPSFVVTNLTPADRLATENKWLTLQAELWAREVAGGITTDDEVAVGDAANQPVRISPAQIMHESSAAVLKDLSDRQRLLGETERLINAQRDIPAGNSLSVVRPQLARTGDGAGGGLSPPAPEQP